VSVAITESLTAIAESAEAADIEVGDHVWLWEPRGVAQLSGNSDLFSVGSKRSTNLIHTPAAR
jgi:hypothetical protein